MACNVELATSGPFSPGNTINGKIVCLFDIAENIQGIKCSLIGQERTQFFGDDGTKQAGYESFLWNDIEILGASSIQPGTYKYPFSFDLPAGIPSSFEHKNGTVVYEIAAVISRGAALFYRNSQTIEVSMKVDLNDMAQEITMAPMTYPIEEKQAACWSWLCYNADLSLSLSLEKDAFLVGETIKVKVDIKTVTGVGISCVKAKLLAHTEVISKYPKNKTFVAEDTIVKKTDEEGQEGNSQKVYSFDLEVPRQLNLPSLSKCKLIKQRYSITAIVHLNGCFLPIKLQADIKLGHISVQEPRPIGFSQPPEKSTNPSILHTSKYNESQAQTTVANHLSYPIDDSNVPLLNRHHEMPPLPAVHFPASYNVIPSAPPTATESYPRRNQTNFGTRAEDAALLSQESTDQLIAPPTYDEAILQ